MRKVIQRRITKTARAADESRRGPETHVRCRLCLGWYEAITYTHLKARHGILRPAEYKQQFGVLKITSVEVRRKVAESKKRILRSERAYILGQWGQHSLRTISKRLGVNPSTVRTHAYRLGLPPLRQAWDKKKVVRALRRARREGKPLHSGGARRAIPLVYRAARSHFGSWDRAVESAGFSYRSIMKSKPFEQWSRLRIVEEIRRLAVRPERLSYRHLNRHCSKLYAAARNYFGSWRSALSAAGLEAIE